MGSLVAQAATLPPVPQPPHDPTFLLLNRRVAWKLAYAENVVAHPATGNLTLALIPGIGRSVAEPSGSLGGMVLPSNVALGPEGAVYLLDVETQRILVLDMCDWKFRPLPHIGGKGAGARQFQEARSIAICNGNVYVADTGNRRVSIFSLHGLALRAHRRRKDWEPAALAFNGQGILLVADRAQGLIHRFLPSGRTLQPWSGFGPVFAVAVDCNDRVYAIAEGDDQVRVVDADGMPLLSVADAEALGPNFPCPPFPIDAQGGLDLRGLGGPYFSSSGKVIPPPPGPQFPYKKAGFALLGPLDSNFYRCQWHRIVPCMNVPKGASLRFSTFTAEAELSLDYILSIPAEQFATRQTAAAGTERDWDCLIRSGQGRYLWLRIDFTSTGAVTPAVCDTRIEFPRISLRRYLPAIYGQEPVSADFTDRFLSLFDTGFRSIEWIADNLAMWFDPLATPAGFLPWLASWVGTVFDPTWPESRRRYYLKNAARLFLLRGTREGLRQQVLLFLGLSACECCQCEQSCTCTPKPRNCAPPKPQACPWEPPRLILEHYQLRRWLFVGQGRLGDDAVLWGKRIVNRAQLSENSQADAVKLIGTPDPYHDPLLVHAYRFSVFVPAACGSDPAARRSLLRMIEAEKPAHTVAQTIFVEPRFRIGFQSMIGLDSVVARYPAGITLDQTTLGGASVIPEAPGARGGPKLEIGRSSTLGQTTRLE
jgi:phage tail-like protein